MKKVLFLLPFLACGPAFSDQPADFDKTMQGVATDLSALHQKLQQIYGKHLPPSQGFSPLVVADVIAAMKKAGIVTITADSAGVYKGAALDAELFESVSAGKQFPLLDKVGDWYAIALDNPVEGVPAGWVQAAKAVPSWDLTMVGDVASVAEAAAKPSLTERVYAEITAAVNDVRLKYDKDPYVGITGFSVEMSLPPGVSIMFEFK